MVGEDLVEGFGEAVQRAAPGVAGRERDLTRLQIDAVALDVVVGANAHHPPPIPWSFHQSLSNCRDQNPSSRKTPGRQAHRPKCHHAHGGAAI
jgi:hypothetical protein